MFVHGVGVNGDLWRDVAPALADEHRCIVPDLPFGAHSLPLRDDADLSLPGMARIVADFIEALGLEEVAVVANDTGGAVAQWLVGHHPERIGRLVLTSCDAFEKFPPTPQRYLEVGRAFPGARCGWSRWTVRFKLVQRLPTAYGWVTQRPIDPAIMRSYTDADPHDAGRAPRPRSGCCAPSTRATRSRRRSRCAASTGPALVLWAAGDKIFPRDHGRRLAELLPQGRFELVARQPHVHPGGPARQGWSPPCATSWLSGSTQPPTSLESTVQPEDTDTIGPPPHFPGGRMTSIGSDLENVLVTERELWLDGPPHELFRELRSECPVHWTERITEYPEEDGYWSVTTADDVHAVSRDWQTYSSERGGITAATGVFPLELVRAMFIGMDPPKHDRIKALFQAGFTPKRIAAHEDAIRAIVDRRARPARRPGDLRPRHRRRAAGRLARDRQLHGHPAGGRRGLGEPHELDARRRRPGPEPGRHRGRRREGHPRDLRALPADDRRAAREPDRRPDERARPRRDRRAEARGARDRDGLLPARRGGQRQHQGDLLQRDAGADGATRTSARSCSTTRR